MTESLRPWLALALAAVASAEEPSLLTSLPSRYASAKWTKFVEERKNDAEALYAFVKAPKKEQKDDKVGPAVVKVLARCRLPVRALLDTFQTKDAEILAEWK